MKNKVLKSLSILLSFALIFGMLPTTAFAALAADNEGVLTSIGHKDTDTVNVSSSQRDITLTAPYGTATVNLASNLKPEWDSAYTTSSRVSPRNPVR